MQSALKTRVVRIGNSQGIRIPKLVLEQLKLHDEIELQVKDGELIVRPLARARAGWAEQCRQMAERGDDQLLDPETLSASKWDGDEWKW